ncbi:pyridoxal phosphate enzyme, YggS family, partial [Ostertagia ostertagi]
TRDWIAGEACNKSALTKRCRLVAVSKTKPAELIAACYEIGQRHFGENYELEEKSNALQNQCPEIKWHYIGKIQSNKIGKICSSPSLYCVETIESAKHWLSIEDAPDLACYIADHCSSLRFAGFMTIGSFDHSHVVPNPDFDRLYQVREAWAKRVSRSPDEVELSMGMSDDFETAIAQGSTSVRVGSKIFGPRLYKSA